MSIALNVLHSARVRTATFRTWGPRILSKTHGIMILLLVLMLGWLSAQLTWALVGFWNPSAQLSQLSPHAVSHLPSLAILIREASAEPLFGPAGANRPLSAIRPTHLALSLLGIAISPHQPSSSWAIIAEGHEQGAPERVFTTGSTLPGGARIVSIQPLAVILNLDGELQSLGLNSGGGPSAPAGPGFAASPPRLSGLPGLLAQRPLALMQYIHPMPVFKNGRFTGYRVFPGIHPRLFMQAGLAPGDIIEQINGEPLTSPIQSLDLLRSLGHSQQPIQLTVVQHGLTRIITLPTRALSDSRPQ